MSPGRATVPALAVVALACLWGCTGRGAPPASLPPESAFAQSSRVYVLGRTPDQERERAFQELLDSAQAAAIDLLGALPEAGLSYSMSPKGTVYPFSQVEVACLVRKSDYAGGKYFCREFFRFVDAGLAGVLEPR